MDDNYIQNFYKLYYSISSGIEINSKNVKTNSIFVAIKGKNFNGNQFAYEAIINGALISIVDDKKYAFNHKKIFFVENSLNFLHKLACFHRKQLKYIPIIAITGSNGKTTTKELVASILSKKYHIVHYTKSNFNNHIGIPLTILSIPKNANLSVIEIGANHEKEIEKMCSIINPDYGYITNFGKAHLEGFGNINGVIRSKLELYNFLRQNNKTVFVNGDDNIQLTNSLGISRYIFSEKKFFDVNIKYDCTTICNTIYVKNKQFFSKYLIGYHNVYNIASAITIGIYFNVSLKDIQKSIINFIPNNNRFQIIKKDKFIIYNDCYNANPSSMISVLNFFNTIKGKKIAILGDMLELGKFSIIEHTNIINFLKKSTIDISFVIGKHFCNVTLNLNCKKIIRLYNTDEFIKWWYNNKYYINTDYIIIKGSRKNALENIIHLF
ncbi:UDP-N-acetylmuramoyl-tripeptide--D-alanyl-D-alanine ligase [Blattabacterium cuenoti]|uniref:UDP-N-acetylmuramoyl-tripeptide--D-alanyl-D- alanine ligase n=1 Tax=Blattabacterium cuenoti TaxID=1653831 RepID=UPI00163C834E|nr:UDP-N-acetylmuramoyl-tripeptide--D-alanyl-D-alanine ligase [Blattabacterium cuenoti]